MFLSYLFLFLNLILYFSVGILLCFALNSMQVKCYGRWTSWRIFLYHLHFRNILGQRSSPSADIFNVGKHAKYTIKLVSLNKAYWHLWEKSFWNKYIEGCENFAILLKFRSERPCWFTTKFFLCRIFRNLVSLILSTKRKRKS